MKVKVTQPVQVVHNGERYTLGHVADVPGNVARAGYARVDDSI